MMMSKRLKLIGTTISLVVAIALVSGCDDSSENIPNNEQGTGWQGIEELMDAGWNAYNAGNFEDAQEQFRDANERNASYLPAYNGLGWCAVRLNDFVDAEIQFSFITTLADPDSLPDLLADAYAGLSLSATIERLFMEISGEGDETLYQSLMQESIDMANLVFSLVGEDYTPVDHDPDFNSASLHLMNAQNYFYLQEFANCEAQLSIVDTSFIETQLATYGEFVNGEVIELTRDDSWILSPANAALHHLTDEITPPSYLPWEADYEWTYGGNSISVIQSLGEYEEISYEWVEINPDRGGLPGIDTGIQEDDQVEGPFDIEFDFPFYSSGDTTYSIIYLTSNGFASFSYLTSTHVTDNFPIPTDSLPNNLVAPYWDDFNLDPIEGHGQVFYYYDAAANLFYVEWDSVALADTSIHDEYFTFEMVLYPNGRIDFLYKTIVPGTANFFPSATVGIEDNSGASGLSITYNGNGAFEPDTESATHIYRPLVEGMEFTVSYVSINDFDQYLFELIEHIQSLIDI